MMAALLRFALLILLAISASAAPAQAPDNISALETQALPALPGTAAPLLLVIDGLPVALQAGQAQVLRPGAQRWQRLDSSLSEQIAGVAVGGGRAAGLVPAEQGDAPSVMTFALQENRLTATPLGSMPVALDNLVMAVSAEEIAVAGLDQAGRPQLLRRGFADGQWTVTPGWPAGGMPAAMAAQAGALYVLLRDGTLWRWSAKAGWQARTAASGPVAAGFARPISQANLLALIGVPGGSVLHAYSTITDAWAPLDHREAGRIAAPLGNGLITLTPAADGWRAERTELVLKRRALGWLDWTVVAAYLAGMLGIGFYFWQRSRMGSTSEFFLGSRAIPFWAAGVSMFATNTSSISYLAVPAKAFDTDWQYMMSKIVTVCGLAAAAFWVIPLFRRLNLVSVFSYLETRFHPTIRMLSSALAILMHVGGRMGVVLFLPALAIGTITGMDVTLCILVVGICTIIYTALGGMKAVVWTDFFQVVVLLSGALFAVGFIVHSVGAGQVVATALAYDKTKLVNLSTDFTTPTLWGFIILVTFDTILTFPKDQVLMQRVLSTSSEKAASRSVWFFAAVLLPAGFLFYVIGTTLFAYYHANPGRLDPLLPVDAVFPAFIGTELPHGVTGMIIAGLFAAAMGTLSGTINSVATLLSVDFYARLKSVPPTQQQSVRFAEWMTVLVGVVGIMLAIILSRLDVRSLLDLTIELFGLLGGSCAGAYSLGMFTTRANWQGVAIGIVAASLVTLVAWMFALVHPYFYLAIAIVCSISIGYAASLCFPAPRREQLEGLTIYTGGGRLGRRDVPSTPVS